MPKGKTTTAAELQKELQRVKDLQHRLIEEVYHERKAAAKFEGDTRNAVRIIVKILAE